MSDQNPGKGQSVLALKDAVEKYESGCKAAHGAVKAVSLYGSWYDMGRQYGALLRNELHEIVSFVEHIASLSKENAESAELIGDSMLRQTSYQVRRFMQGAAETSGLTMRQMAYAYAVEYIAGLPQCSTIAVWDAYAKDRLVFGRNYDYGEAFRELSQDVVVTVFHPADGALASAIIGYAGEIYAVNGMNEKGIFLELNNGTPSTGVPRNPARICGTSCLMDVLFKADTMDYLERFFETVLCDDSYIINAADGSKARSYEWSQQGVKHGEIAMPRGLLVSTNHYQHPDWPYARPDDAHSWDSVTRLNNLKIIAEKEKGGIDAERMTQILDIPFEAGGVTDNLTVYQMVAEPATLSLRIKICGASDWVMVDLGSFLK